MSKTPVRAASSIRHETIALTEKREPHRRAWRALLAALGALAVTVSVAPALADPPPRTDMLRAEGAFGAESSAGVQSATGVAVASHPIAFPPARGVPQPILGLAYAHTNTAVSEVGVAWSLGLPTIERRGLAGGPPLLDASDVHYLSGDRLVEVGVVGADKKVGGVLMPHWAVGWLLFRPAVDPSYTRIFRSASGDTFRIVRSTGEILELGVPQFLGGVGAPNEGGVDRTSTGVVTRWKLVRQFEVYAAGSSPRNIILYGWERSTADDTSRIADIYYTPAVAGAPDSTDSYAHHIHLAYGQDWYNKQLRHVRPPPWRLVADRVVECQAHQLIGESS